MSVLVINLSESSVIPITRDHIVKIVLPGITQLIVGLDSGPENLATLRTHSSHSWYTPSSLNRKQNPKNKKKANRVTEPRRSEKRPNMHVRKNKKKKKKGWV